MKTGTIVTVLDIGTSKICCCITSIAADGCFTILGTGYCACFGVKAGIVKDTRSVERSISKALEIAETAASFRVRSVYVSISGSDIRSCIALSALKMDGKVVQNEDIVQLISLLNNNEDRNYAIIHAIPIVFTADNQIIVKNPVGIAANEVQMSSNVVSAPRKQINGILTCLDGCHLELSGIVLSCYASGLCVFNEEYFNGIVVDFGAGTTSIAFFYKGVLCGAEIIPIGGNNITDDIAFGLSIPTASAERIKTLYGAAFASIDDENSCIYVPVLEGANTIDLQRITRSTLNTIIQSRVEEILVEVRERIEKSMFKEDFVNSRVVITGGGSQLTGIEDFAVSILKRSVTTKQINSHGVDRNIQVSNDFSVAFGMIKFAQMVQKEVSQRKKTMKCKRNNFIEKMKNWLRNN